MHDLPQSTLAAIVIVAVLGLIDIVGARRLRNWRRSEFTLAMVAFAGVAVLGVLWGVGIAIALSLLNFIRRAWRPHDAVLGRVDNLKGYHDTERYPDARHIPGLVLYRFDAPLFFANADYFRERVRALARAGDVRWIVVAAEPITDIDATAGETLRALNDELDAVGIELAFAELKDPVRDRLRRYGIETAIGADRFFPTMGVAVAAYLHHTGVDWLDWEDRRPPTTPFPTNDVDGPSRAQLEWWVVVGHEDERVRGHAVRPAADADEVVEQPAWEATGEEDREPRGDDREYRADVEEEEHHVVWDREQPLHQRQDSGSGGWRRDTGRRGERSAARRWTGSDRP